MAAGGPVTDRSLRAWNVGAGLAHGIQAAIFVVLSEAVSLPVTATFAAGPPGTPVDPSQLEELFSYPLAPAVALFSGLSALFHILVASPLGWEAYRRELDRHRNRFRWVEYSLSATLMIVLIAGITGITDVAALVGIAAANAAMIWFGWLMETRNTPDRPVSWSPFVFGSLVGAAPWFAIGIYLIGAGSSVPTFVYAIFVSIFVLFNCFAINQWLQYRQIGPWSRYRFGELAYLVLSLVAKSLLAWQIYANVLTGGG